MGKQYNYCLDFIKGIACIFVVLMHCEFPGRLGIVVQTISRFCVPIFFMVSGYFCFKEGAGKVDYQASFRKKTGHIFRITLYACLFYLLFVLVQQFIWGDQNLHISLAKVVKWLVFNDPFIVAGQYWFLFALLYVYIMYALINRVGAWKIIYPFAGVMLLAYYCLAQGAHLAGVHFPNMVYRNFLIEGFAFFTLGRWIHEHQDRLHCSNGILLAVIVLSTLLCIPERYVMGRDFGVNICTLPQVFALFLYAVNNPERHEGIVQRIGKRYSMFVYIIHPMVWHSLDRAYSAIGISSSPAALYLRPILVVLLTLLVSHLVFLVNERTAKTKVSHA